MNKKSQIIWKLLFILYNIKIKIYFLIILIINLSFYLLKIF